MNSILKWPAKLALLVLGLLCWSAVNAAAQAGESLTLRMNRDFGYASGTGKVQGTFTLKATGLANLQRVVFYIDDQKMGEVTQAPFNLRFYTDSYPLGRHLLRAEGFTAGGATLDSNEIEAFFVTAEEGWQAAARIGVPLLAVTVGLVLLSAVFSFVGAGKLKNLPPGTPRSYGWAGGAICKRCGRPFPRRVLSPNMVTGKLERCPYCGHWAVVAAAPLPMLRAAEAAEIADAQAGALPQDEDEDALLRKRLDESRYQ